MAEEMVDDTPVAVGQTEDDDHDVEEGDEDFMEEIKTSRRHPQTSVRKRAASRKSEPEKQSGALVVKDSKRPRSRVRASHPAAIRAVLEIAKGLDDFGLASVQQSIARMQLQRTEISDADSDISDILRGASRCDLIQVIHEATSLLSTFEEVAREVAVPASHHTMALRPKVMRPFLRVGDVVQVPGILVNPGCQGDNELVDEFLSSAFSCLLGVVMSTNVDKTHNVDPRKVNVYFALPQKRDEHNRLKYVMTRQFTDKSLEVFNGPYRWPKLHVESQQVKLVHDARTDMTVMPGRRCCNYQPNAALVEKITALLRERLPQRGDIEAYRGMVKPTRNGLGVKIKMALVCPELTRLLTDDKRTYDMSVMEDDDSERSKRNENYHGPTRVTMGNCKSTRHVYELKASGRRPTRCARLPWYYSGAEEMGTECCRCAPSSLRAFAAIIEKVLAEKDYMPYAVLNMFQLLR